MPISAVYEFQYSIRTKPNFQHAILQVSVLETIRSDPRDSLLNPDPDIPLRYPDPDQNESRSARKHNIKLKGTV